MLTRRMAEDLSRQIELLTAQLEEQRLQIASLSQEREDSESVPNRTVEQLAAQLEQQRLQITLLTQAQNRSDQLETGSSRIARRIPRLRFDKMIDFILMPYKGYKKVLCVVNDKLATMVTTVEGTDTV